MNLDLGGKIRNRLPSWVDVALHVVVELDGTRKVLTKPQSIDGRSFYAKDRYNSYNGRAFTIHFNREGRISDGILDPILGHCTGGSRQDHEAMALAEAKEALIEAAVAKGITGRCLPHSRRCAREERGMPGSDRWLQSRRSDRRRGYWRAGL